MAWLTGLVFVLTYVGMAAGRLPGLGVDRAWIALGGAMVLLLTGAVSLPQAGTYVDWEAMLLLLAMMLISSQFRFSGVYERAGGLVADLAERPQRLLAAVVIAGGLLSALLVNDVVALALAPPLITSLRRAGLAVMPYLLALACACNAGSAATLVGNPQNILIGQVAGLDFWSYLAWSLVPAALALACVFAVVGLAWRGRWRVQAALELAPDPVALAGLSWRPKPWIALGLLLLLFATPLPRELAALAIAVWVMASRHRASRDYVSAVDWNLLLLFAGLFIVTGAAGDLPWATVQATALAARGPAPDGALGLAAMALAGSNLVGNVPFVMLWLEVWPRAPDAVLMALALLSTLAGNLLLVGSVVNLIVAECARRQGIRLGFVGFAAVGVPVTLLSMALAVAWLVLIGRLPLT